ncbi:hypothetical protein [Hymenobacter sediminicola]|uniref:PKD domain-containing protein n=1 Tax=Hymenobacter sediminicola TaxID=2761579 RepID=A0A7G7W3Q0_9BACT|nr:hypothetical protein [Hymenobacter sediminicola]QNH60993.1 hypothetical protein H4317_12460 [Hymenobacter sediminicola]
MPILLPVLICPLFVLVAAIDFRINAYKQISQVPSLLAYTCLMNKKEKLNAIVNSCERLFGRGAASSWTHSDFVELSQEILRDTKVNISPSTLKRIFGKVAVEDDYLPQQATIEALEKFGGYSTPESSQSSAIPEAVPAVEPAPVVAAETVLTSTSKSSQYPKVALAVAATLLLLLGILTLAYFWPRTQPAGRITLTDVEGVLPATAFFRLQAPAERDSLFVDFGDKSAMVYVVPDQENIAHNYLYPGVFTVKLRNRQDTVSTTKVLVRSDGWLGLGFNRPQDLPNHYYAFPAGRSGPDSLFHIANRELHNIGLDTTSPFFTRLCNFTPVASSPDNFVFEATFKNEAQGKRIYCRSSQFQITGLKNILRFKLASPGCSYRILNVVSEQNFRGNKINLSQFVINPDQWNTVKLVNKNKHVSLLVNDKLLFTGPYKKSLGEIKGLFLEFEGNGFIKNCRLTALDGKVLYRF